VTTAQRVLVTGGRGFLGSHVVRALLASDRDVAVLTRSRSAPPMAGDDAGKVAIISGSLQDREQLRDRISEWRPDACIHLAWYAEPGRYLESPENLSALDGTLALLQALIDVGCATVAMAGSCAEYDTDQGWLNEDTPLRPRTIYAASKASGSMLVQQLAKDTGTSVAWARIFYPYGPFEDRRRAVPALILSLLEGRRFAASAGDQVRDYVYGKDAAEAFVTLIDQRASGAFNVASGVPITIRQLMEMIGDQLGGRDLIDFGAAPPRAWEPRFIAGDTTRLRSLGWSPRYTLDRGLEETIAWWREHHR
jgi:nucleoside-diphosphate-sugar epimerase